MSWDERNLPCFCGKINPKTWGILKRKNCYNKPESENICSYFLESKKSEYVGIIQRHLDLVVKEVNFTLLATLNDNEATRTKTICVCSMLDVFSNFWRIFSDIRDPGDVTKMASDTFAWKEWFNEFIENPDNNEWQKWKTKYPNVSIEWSDFYQLRSGLSHFFGFSKKSRLFLITNGETGKESELSKIGIAEINPQIIFLFASIWATLMIDKINKEITNEIGLLKLRNLYIYVRDNWVEMIHVN